jgi:hypothetical protein
LRNPMANESVGIKPLLIIIITRTGHSSINSLPLAFNMLLISGVSTALISGCWWIVLLGLPTAFNMPRWGLNVPTRTLHSRSQRSRMSGYHRQMQTYYMQTESQSFSAPTLIGGLLILSYRLLSMVPTLALRDNPQVICGGAITPPHSFIPVLSQNRSKRKLRRGG